MNLETLHQKLEVYIEQQEFKGSPVELYRPVNYILRLGGKRIRPLILLLSAQSFHAKIETALPVAFVMELFHNFTLVHDDIMDNARLRRGQATVHEKYGNNTAILSGDVMMIWCYKYLLDLPDNKFKKIIHLFNDTAIKVCEGQQMDMDFETKANVFEEEYLKMIEYKTSALLACCFKAGALLGDASNEDALMMYEFGRNIGLSFQLLDDLLDAFGQVEKVGKIKGGDIQNHKKTLLLIKTLSLTPPSQQSVLNAYFQDSSKVSVSEILQIMEDCGAKKYVEEKASAFHHKALEQLHLLRDVSDENKKILSDFVNQLIQREM